MTSSSEYKITIKSANQKVDDYVTNCESSWSVNRLKQHIAETHVNKPNIEDQRLIYAGNLLKDSQTLKQVFFRDSLCTDLTNSSKTDFTIHLVCTQKIVTNTSKSSGNNSSGSRLISNGRAQPYIPAGIAASRHGNISSNDPLNQNTSRPPSSTSTSASFIGPPNNAQPNSSSINTGSGATASDQSAGSATNNNNPFNDLFSNLNSTTSSSASTDQAALNFMQSEQIRQKLALFDQLANAVAAQMTTLIANSQRDNLAPHLNTTTEQLSQMLNSTATVISQASSSNLRLPTANAPCNTPEADSASHASSNSANPIEPLQVDAETRALGRRPASSPVVNNEGNNANDNHNVNEPILGGAAPAAQFSLQMHQAARAAAAAAQQPPAQQDDVVDWIFYSIRAVLILTAFYMNASIFRLLFIFSLLAMAFFITRRVARRTNNRREVQAQGPRVNNGQQQARAERPIGADQDGDVRRRGQHLRADANNNNDSENPNAENGNVERADGQNELIPDRIPFLKLCYLVITDFITSLVPNRGELQ